MAGVGDAVSDVTVEESTEEIVVRVSVRINRGDRPAMQIPLKGTITLESPLADRRVVDGVSGRTVIPVD
jgi:hypothetical protein